MDGERPLAKTGETLTTDNVVCFFVTLRYEEVTFNCRDGKAEDKVSLGFIGGYTSITSYFHA